jgi:hypothetical protein
MGTMKLSKPALVGVIAVIATAVSTSAWAAAPKPTYLLSKNPAVALKVIATTGDTINGLTVRGIPDGMGAYANERGGITLLSSHEISTTAPLALKGKSSTAVWATSITKFNVSPNSMAVTSASDFIKEVNFYNYTTGKYQSTPTGAAPVGVSAGTFDWGISRFCSATYTAAGTFLYNGVGYAGGLYTAGEEVGDDSRGFAFDMDGVGYQLPRMGMTAFENIIPGIKPGPNTVVIGTEDGSATDSQMTIYVGKKQATGTPVDQAGLTNGDLYALNLPNVKTDNIFRTTVGKNKKTAAELKKVEWNTTPALFEDGNWDPTNPNIFYFVTTESNKDPIASASNPATPTVSRDGGALWRLTFKDAQNPLLGAELEMLLNGGEALMLSKPDNITVTNDGKVVLIQEDPGNNALLARVLAYRVSDAKLVTLAQFDESMFKKGGSAFITEDEESSGIIDATALLAKAGDTNAYFFLNTQIHTPTGAIAARPDLAGRSAARKDAINTATIEGGQYYIMTISNWDTVFSG